MSDLSRQNESETQPSAAVCIYLEPFRASSEYNGTYETWWSAQNRLDQLTKEEARPSLSID